MRHIHTLPEFARNGNHMNVGVISPQILFRKAICSLLAETGAFDIVVELAGVFDPLTKVEKSQPGILIVHTVDPAAALGTVRQLHDLLPDIRVLLLANDPKEEFSMQALEAGAWGCLSTSDSPQRLVKALEKVAQGERWVGHQLANLIIEKFVAGQQAEARPTERLTSREWEVLALLANGCSDKEIASRLFISRETAKSHLKSVYKKLQVRNRSAAAVYYFRYFQNQTDSPRHPGATVSEQVQSTH
jgi:DNA-binding NarL/FixJ family response regulator